MKRLINFAILLFAVATLSAQGSFLTKQIEVHIEDLEQPAYAAVAFADSSDTYDLTKDTWSPIVNWVTAGSNDCTASSDTITITKSGTYLIQATLAYQGSDADTIHVSVLKNGTQVGCESTTETADYENVAVQEVLSLTQGDYITLGVMNETDGGDVTVSSGSMYVRRIYY
ncbi:MAG TPA: hypothetical protein HPP51_05445 [Planctomycetes bacterium]|nr:hypothetical protein [Planctomycetota bacterium]